MYIIQQSKKHIVIVGGGPAALLCACFIDVDKYKVTIIEKEKSVGRKFLVAGKGGFNLTHSELTEEMLKQYDAPSCILSSIKEWDNEQLRSFLSEIGIETYIGSSHRVFPIKGTKPIEVLQKIMEVLAKKGVTILTQHRWHGSTIINGNLNIPNDKNNVSKIPADVVIFAMGGGSWSVTGSDGCWLSDFIKMDVPSIALQPSNCALGVSWPSNMIPHLGKPIKNISLSYQNKTIKGEMLITEFGIEGTPAYTLSYPIGKALQNSQSVTITLDLKPTLTIVQINRKLNRKSKKITHLLKDRLNLCPASIALLKCMIDRETFIDLSKLCLAIKNLPIDIHRLARLDEAISTTGGVSKQAISANFEIDNYPNHYAIGEMLDWNAPTGGYLLQACMSMGVSLARHLNSKVCN